MNQAAACLLAVVVLDVMNVGQRRSAAVAAETKRGFGESEGARLLFNSAQHRPETCKPTMLSAADEPIAGRAAASANRLDDERDPGYDRYRGRERLSGG